MIYILGLDGVDYNFIEKWDLKNIKQNHYSQIEVPIDKNMLIPKSPEVWASFLTGKNVDNIDFINISPYSKIRQNILKTVKILRKHIPLSLGIGEVIRDIPTLRFPNLNKTTFLDITKSKSINVPYYNYDHKEFEKLKKLRDDNVSIDELIDEIYKLWEERKGQILYESKNIKNYDVVFAFENCSDQIQHFSFLRPEEIKKFYSDMNNYILKLKKVVGKCTFFIVSDHGFDLNTEKHSLYGFYSSNILIKPEPTKITDFYNIVLKHSRI